MAKINLKSVKEETHDTKSFVFDKPAGLTFTAGQLLHWTLPHDHPDDRGNRRPFTISASPTEDFLMFTTKFAPENGSSYTAVLAQAQPGKEFEIDEPLGSFVFPEDPAQPVVFLGGGVGITPFRSMIKFATDEKLPRPLTLLYANKTPGDIIYRAEFDEWARINPNFKLAYTVDHPSEGWTGGVGYLNAEMIRKYVPDLEEAVYYICGPAGMITAYRQILTELGLPDDLIRTENFSGYV